VKRHILLVISVLALTAMSQSPAPAQQQPPRASRTGSQVRQPTQANWTGSQVVGFGGGNAGGSGFADPCFGPAGFTSPCLDTRTDQSRSPISVTGGVAYRYAVPWGPYVAAIGGEIAAARIKSSNTLSNTHCLTAGCGFVTSETQSVELIQGTNASLLFSFGLPIWNNWAMVYATGGMTVGSVSGSTSYLGASAQSTGNGAASWDKALVGLTFGGSFEWIYTQFVKLGVEARYTDYGTINHTVPLLATGCLASLDVVCTNGVSLVSQRVSNTKVILKVIFAM
jgi:opacity protein-like surface antigen